MSSKNQIVQSISKSLIPAAVQQDIIDKLDDITIAGCKGVDPNDIDSEDVTLIHVCLDASGSMQPYEKTVVDAYNESFLKPICGAKNAESILIATSVFSGHGTNAIRLLHSFMPAKQCPQLTRSDYHPDGETPLYRAVHSAQVGILDYGNLLKDNGVRVKRIVVVFSDGEDNASGGFTTTKLQALSQTLLDTETCILSYAFMGDKRSADKNAKDIGFPINSQLNEDMISQGDAAIRRLFGTASASSIKASQSTIVAGNSFIP